MILGFFNKTSVKLQEHPVRVYGIYQIDAIGQAVIFLSKTAQTYAMQKHYEKYFFHDKIFEMNKLKFWTRRLGRGIVQTSCKK
jgi:hypothetical protein